MPFEKSTDDINLIVVINALGVSRRRRYSWLLRPKMVEFLRSEQEIIFIFIFWPPFTYGLFGFPPITSALEAKHIHIMPQGTHTTLLH